MGICLGILGAGYIAQMMAEAAAKTDGVEMYAVAARDLERAEAFAGKWGFEKAYGSYDEMLADDKVDLVYVATPHSHHYQHMKLCLNYGKNILCEKAFTRNAKEAKEIFEIAEAKGVLVTEAIWTRYMPSRRMIDDLLKSGVIGRPTSLSANLCYIIDWKPRLTEPSLAGGALLDVGIYPLNFATMVFGQDVVDVSSSAVLTDKGVDGQNSIHLTYKNGSIAVLYSSMYSQSDRRGMINGDKGFMEVVNINNCEEIRIYNLDRKLKETHKVPEQINGYEYELMACRDAIGRGEIECPQMTHKETIWMMELMDGLRKKWGVVYPGE